VIGFCRLLEYRQGERIDKLLFSQVLENEKECPENGSFLDTSILA
jgi:hypothetical protein